MVKSGKVDALMTEKERPQKNVADLESEKTVIAAEKSVLASANTTEELDVLDLRAELAELSTRMAEEIAEAEEKELKLREAVNVGVEENSRVC